MPRSPLPLVCCAVLAACGGGAGGVVTPGKPGQSLTVAPPSTSATATAVARAAAWTEYGGAAGREQFGRVDTGAGAPAVRWRSPQLHGTVLAEPLVDGGRILTVTDSNDAYAVSATDGSIMWHTSLGPNDTTPVSDCASPSLNGATGTPVVDAQRGLMYTVYLDAGGVHRLAAIDVSTGAVRFTRAIDPPGDESAELGDRGALALANGMVYIPFGGRTGDCGHWHGWVVAVHADGSPGMQSYEVPTALWGGIWAPAGVDVLDDGSIVVATANGDSDNPDQPFDGTEAVLHLSAQLALLDWWRPSDASQRDPSDADVGSTGPVQLGGGRLLQATKRGHVYILDSGHLGHDGGELFAGAICQDAIGAAAYSQPDAMVFIPCTNGVDALHVVAGASGLALAWHAGNSRFGPALATSGELWIVDVGTAILHVYRDADGHEAGSLGLSSVSHFVAPVADGGQVVLAAGAGLIAVVQQTG